MVGGGGRGGGLHELEGAPARHRQTSGQEVTGDQRQVRMVEPTPQDGPRRLRLQKHGKWGGPLPPDVMC